MEPKQRGPLMWRENRREPRYDAENLLEAAGGAGAGATPATAGVEEASRFDDAAEMVAAAAVSAAVDTEAGAAAEEADAAAAVAAVEAAASIGAFSMPAECMR